MLLCHAPQDWIIRAYIGVIAIAVCEIYGKRDSLFDFVFDVLKSWPEISTASP